MSRTKKGGSMLTRLFKNKKLSILLAAVLVAGIASYVYFDSNRVQPGTDSSNDQPITENEEDPAPEPANNGTPKQPTTPSPKPNAPTASGSQTNSISVTITAAEDSGTTIMARALVDGIKSGTCTATFSKSGQKSVVKTVPVGLATDYYVCQGFDVPQSEFPAKGLWTLVVRASGGGKYNDSASKAIEVK